MLSCRNRNLPAAQLRVSDLPIFEHFVIEFSKTSVMIIIRICFIFIGGTH